MLAPGGRDVENAGVGQRVLKPESGPSLGRGLDLPARSLGAGRVGHGVGLVEHDHALEGVTLVFFRSPREPGDDLLEPRGLALAGRRAQRGVGREQDALRERDLRSLAELAQGDHVVLVPPEGSPVPAGVLHELVGLREPQGPFPSAEPVVEEDPGDLPALAASRAVAQHPAAAEAHRLGERLAVLGRAGGTDPGIIVVAAVDGLPLPAPIR